jgi:hypothetical protein
MEVFEYRGKWGGVRHLGQTWVSEEVVPSDPRDLLRAKSHQLRWLQMSGRTARIAAPVGPAGKGAGRLTAHNQEQSVDQEAAGRKRRAQLAKLSGTCKMAPCNGQLIFADLVFSYSL